MIKVCPQCNKQFNAASKESKFCSRKCASLSLSKKQKLTCPICGKTMYAYKDQKYCSRECANSARHGVKLRSVVLKECANCGKRFESQYPSQKFCSIRCSNEGKRYPSKHNMSNEGHESLSSALKARWKNETFRDKAIKRMIVNNPSYDPKIIEKAHKTRLKNNSYRNNFKYGNGKISRYEQLIYDKLIPLGFKYNYAISTKFARQKYPDDNFAYNYKPDFVNLEKKLCIEIDGSNHLLKNAQILDAKKEKCLAFLGYQVIRFTHSDIDEGVFNQWLNSYLKSI